MSELKDFISTILQNRRKRVSSILNILRKKKYYVVPDGYNYAELKAIVLVEVKKIMADQTKPDDKIFTMDDRLKTLQTTYLVKNVLFILKMYFYKEGTSTGKEMNIA